MRVPNLTEAARVTRRLLDQYGPARLLRVEASSENDTKAFRTV